MMKPMMVVLAAASILAGDPLSVAAQNYPASRAGEPYNGNYTRYTPFGMYGLGFGSGYNSALYYPYRDYTDLAGVEDVGDWNYGFETYGIDIDLDGFYEPPTAPGAAYPVYIIPAGR